MALRLWQSPGLKSVFTGNRTPDLAEQMIILNRLLGFVKESSRIKPELGGLKMKDQNMNWKCLA